MNYVENNVFQTEKVMELLHSIYSDHIEEQCSESEYPQKIRELQDLKNSIIALPFHLEIPDKIMHWIHIYFSDHYMKEDFYNFRHYTQRCFIHVLEETIQTLEYDLSIENKINAVDISDILGKIFKS